jgi:putative protease
MGVSRIVFGREIGLDDAKRIKDKVDIEIELFIHGSMCMAYSGNCVISNYTQGRDSNRGGCAHSCRFQYSLDIPGQKDKTSSFFMSSKDLNGLMQLPKFIDAGVDSLKVEGRMKNHLYLSTVTGVYRAAIDEYSKNKKLSPEFLAELDTELTKFAHRGYTEASLIKPAGEDSVYRDRETATNSHQVIGKVLEVKNNEFFFLAKNPIENKDTIELVNFEKINQSFVPESFYDINGNLVEKTKPNRIYKTKLLSNLKIESGNILRKQNENA